MTIDNDPFMPGCTHPGVPKGANCPLCGRTA